MTFKPVDVNQQPSLQFIRAPRSRINKPPIHLYPLEYSFDLLLRGWRDMHGQEISIPSLKYVLLLLGYAPHSRNYQALRDAIDHPRRLRIIKTVEHRSRGTVIFSLKRRKATDYTAVPVRLPRKSIISCGLYLYLMSWYRAKDSKQKYPVRYVDKLCDLIGIQNIDRGPTFMRERLEDALVEVNRHLRSYTLGEKQTLFWKHRVRVPESFELRFKRGGKVTARPDYPLFIIDADEQHDELYRAERRLSYGRRNTPKRHDAQKEFEDYVAEYG